MQVAEQQVTAEELMVEFARMYKCVHNQSPPRLTEAIILLTADGIGQGEDENFSRAKHSVRTYRDLPADTPIYWNGVTEEAGYGPELLRKLGAPTHVAHFQDCGPRGVANTKTQFEVIVTDERTRNLRNIVLITNSYHIPRVERTAGKLLPNTMSFVVLADMQDYSMFNTFLKVSGEIDRILKYSEKGDILARPR